MLEFQRSTIHPDQVAARERFHRRLIWVIDGTRNEFDPINFNIMRSGINSDGLVGFQWFSRSKLFHRWHTTTPMFIDFGTAGFWRILRFDTESRRGVAGLVGIEAFVQLASSGTMDFRAVGGPASR